MLSPLSSNASRALSRCMDHAVVSSLHCSSALAMPSLVFGRTGRYNNIVIPNPWFYNPWIGFNTESHWMFLFLCNTISNVNYRILWYDTLSFGKFVSRVPWNWRHSSETLVATYETGERNTLEDDSLHTYNQ